METSSISTPENYREEHEEKSNNSLVKPHNDLDLSSEERIHQHHFAIEYILLNDKLTPQAKAFLESFIKGHKGPWNKTETIENVYQEENFIYIKVKNENIASAYSIE